MGTRMTSEAAPYFLEGLGGASRATGADVSGPHVHEDAIPVVADIAPECHNFLAKDSRTQTNLSDETLLEQLHERNREALGILFHRYARMVRAVAYRILRDASEADDLVQEVFLFIFRKGTLFDAARGSARSWIVQVTYHRAIDRRRYLASRHFYTTMNLEDAYAFRDDIAFYERSIEGVIGKGMLRRIDEALTEDQRKTMQLYFFEGYALDEIAGLLGQTIGNVRNHYYRGLEKMRKLIVQAKLRVK